MKTFTNLEQNPYRIPRLLVKQNLKLLLALLLQAIVHLGHSVLVGHVTAHERAPAGLLHHFSSVIVGHLAETF